MSKLQERMKKCTLYRNKSFSLFIERPVVVIENGCDGENSGRVERPVN